MAGRSYNRDRCCSKGLGSPLPRSEYRGPLVFGRKKITHQLPRASSGLLCYQNIHQNQSLCSCQTADGQCISSCLYQQDGRNPFPKSFESCNRPVGMVLSTSVSRVGTTSTWAPECGSRPGISSNQRFQRLETQSDSVSGTFQNGGPFQVDLFASRLTHQLPIFASWKPDPLAAYIDAFSVDWGKIQGYAFPPFALIGRCLRQLQVQEVDHLVLVAPVWPTQSWYPLLLQMSIDLPVLIPPSPQLLGKGELLHPLTNLQLAGWRLSAKTVKQQNFQKKLERFCWQPGDKVLAQPIPLPGVSGLAGVLNEKLIHFQLL